MIAPLDGWQVQDRYPDLGTGPHSGDWCRGMTDSPYEPAVDYPTDLNRLYCGGTGDAPHVGHTFDPDDN